MPRVRFILIIFSFVFSTFSECAMNEGPWNKIGLKLRPYQVVETIVHKGDTIILGGAVYTGHLMDIKSAKPFLMYSFNKGRNWIEKSNIDCNSITDLNYLDGTLLITAAKNIETSQGEEEVIYFIYNFLNDQFEEIPLPKKKRSSIVKMLNENTYLFDVTLNQFGNSYLLTKDGGHVWSELLVLMPHKQDHFQEILILDDVMIGIRTHYKVLDSITDKDFQSVVYVNLNTGLITKEIRLGDSYRTKEGHIVNTHWVSDIKMDAQNGIYLLGQDQQNRMGYIWQVDDEERNVKVVYEFKLSDKQTPDKLFFYNNKVFLTYIDMTTLIPTKTILYKHKNQATWTKESCPQLAYPVVSFEQGLLMGVTKDNEIYYKDFQND